MKNQPPPSTNPPKPETRTAAAARDAGDRPTTVPNELNNRPRYAKGQVTLLIVAAILVVFLAMVLHLL
jgi:hypothetical protein